MSWADDADRAQEAPLVSGGRFPRIPHDTDPADPNPADLSRVPRAPPAPGAVWLPDEVHVGPGVAASGNRLFVCAPRGLPAGRVVVSGLFRWTRGNAGAWAGRPGSVPWVRDDRWPVDWFAPVPEVLQAARAYYQLPARPTAGLVSLWAVAPQFPRADPEPRLCVRLLHDLPFGAEVTLDTGLPACLLPHLSFLEQAGDREGAQAVRALISG